MAFDDSRERNEPHEWADQFLSLSNETVTIATKEFEHGSRFRLTPNQLLIWRSNVQTKNAGRALHSTRLETFYLVK
jgi:hypothetical protein